MGINHLRLTEQLRGNEDVCYRILTELGYENITFDKKYFRFSREPGTNPTSMRLSVDTLKFVCFSTNEYGDIYTLAMRQKHLHFPDALQYVAKAAGIEPESVSKQTRYPFSGFYREWVRESEDPETAMPTYEETILSPYGEKYNLLFFHDGINFSTQRHFHVGLDMESNRITIPEYTFDGQLCGIMGRLNDTKCDKGERWLPLLPCSRSLTLYGYHYNYATIQHKNLAIIGESEKFVQQLHSMGCHIGLALCGCNISPTQAKYLKGLMVPRMVLALDEGLPEEQIRAEAEKLQTENTLTKNQVGYIFDRDHQYLPKDSKKAPSDCGKEVFSNLCKDCVVWL